MIRTRFAPSPTGYLHIGSARTALFNYLFAKRYGGSFILRIDDTDRLRNVDLAIKPIMEGLQWLGINWDEGPIYQSARQEHYKDIAEGLIMTGNAYPDPPNGSNNRDITTERAMSLYLDTGWAIRFKIEPGEIVLDDLLKGQITWNTSEIKDPIIIRADGTPTYNFATVVDDAEMKISHVIRAEEHLSNTPVQLLIAHALGYSPPFYAHVPYVCDDDKKLSKRDITKFMTAEVIAKLCEIGFKANEVMQRDDLNPITIAYYKNLGYKPEALVNYLVRLGWSLDGHTEIMSMKEMKENFRLSRVSGPAKFDQKKLMWFAGEYTRKDSLEKRTDECAKFVKQAGIDATNEKIREVVDLCDERIKVYSDIIEYGGFLFKKPRYNPSSVDKYLTPEMTELLRVFAKTLKVIIWDVKTLGEETRLFMETRGRKMSAMVFALRIAISGNMFGPSLFHSMVILGRKECLNRIDVALLMRACMYEYGEG